jgi:hypothetical protein
MTTFKVNQIDDYLNRITEGQAIELIEHCNFHGINP